MTGWSWLTPEENAALDALWANEEAEEKVIAALKQIPAAEYDPDLLSARRVEFLRQIEATNSETVKGLRARLADIINELDDPFIERQRAYALLEEMESIETELEKG
jgi:hypothetical protein